MCLPPHTTHLLQPLDNGAFASLKEHWRSECHHFCTQNPGKVLNCRSFMQVFQKAWVQGMTIYRVMMCFRAVGVYPVDKTVVLSQISVETACSPSRSTAIPTYHSARLARAVQPTTHQQPQIHPRLLPSPLVRWRDSGHVSWSRTTLGKHCG